MKITQEIIESYPDLRKYETYEILEKDKSISFRSKKWDLIHWWLISPEFQEELKKRWEDKYAPKPEPPKPAAKRLTKAVPHHDTPGEVVTLENGAKVTKFSDGILTSDGTWWSNDGEIPFTLGMLRELKQAIENRSKELFATRSELVQEIAALRQELAETKQNFKFVGTWRTGEHYRVGNFAVYNGSTWVCNEINTTDRPGVSSAWTLCARAGRDGKDGR